MISKQQTYRERIVVDPEVLSGKPTIKGTRIPVELVLERLTKDIDTTTLLKDYPRLTMEDIKACLAYAQELIARKNRHPHEQSRSSHAHL
jgi:uncharacterized protein (DUF433 family)